MCVYFDGLPPFGDIPAFEVVFWHLSGIPVFQWYSGILVIFWYFTVQII